jgi:hypothetical protein
MKGEIDSSGTHIEDTADTAQQVEVLEICKEYVKLTKHYNI